MMLLFWGGLFAVVVVILRHFTSGSLRQRNVSPLGSQRGLYRWVTAEVPSIAYRIPEYAELFDESDPAVDPIDRTITTAHQAGMTTSLCGHAPANKPGFAEHLVRLGITSSLINRGDHRGAIGDRVRRTTAAAAVGHLRGDDHEQGPRRVDSARCGVPGRPRAVNPQLPAVAMEAGRQLSASVR
jgi:hypothetical protein